MFFDFKTANIKGFLLIELILPWSESICWPLLSVLLLQRDIRQIIFIQFVDFIMDISKGLRITMQIAMFFFSCRITSCAGCTCTCSGRLQQDKRNFYLLCDPRIFVNCSFPYLDRGVSILQLGHSALMSLYIVLTAMEVPRHRSKKNRSVSCYNV